MTSGAPDGSDMTEADDVERLLPFAGNDPGRALRLRRALDRLRESPDPEIRAMADDVLTGRLAFRDLLTDARFNRVTAERVPQFFQQWDALDEGQKATIVAEGRAQREQDRAEAARLRRDDA